MERERRWRVPYTLALALLTLSVPILFASSTRPSSSNQRASRVLFIGNSLTAANGLPRIVDALAAGAFTSSEITHGNYSLEDHWNGSGARAAIRRGGWSAVVLQQGPSALPESRVLLREYTQRFDREIRAAGGKTVLYMVWPSEARSRDFDAVHDSYALAAADVGGVFAPAGDAWRAAWKRDPSLPLYDADRFHPAPAGTYLAALVLASRLTGKSPDVIAREAAGHRSSILDPFLTSPTSTLFRQAAADALAAADAGRGVR